ncbi:Pyruvate/Phosphoenolpyruvate kinase-like domain-containing protein [Aspergillus cavernicola]|uniref:Pyruvate/Phosphoenolpyruvate kinase-like domain-containing protein n=1 Tax=Aspergillus cavernicola TaxID=176166 RepID=A0ABR4HQG1_9EURO
MSVPYPFKFTTPDQPTSSGNGENTSLSIKLENVRGRIPSAQASRLRTMILEAHNNPDKIIAHACSYDGLSSRLVEEAGFPIVFLAGYTVTSSFGLPGTGYIAMEDLCYGSPMNVKRTVESFAAAGAAGIMIEDQTWPKRCGHTKGKSVVSRGEAFARIQAAVDARNEGQDIFILARTDALIHGWDEALTRAKEFKRIGVDAVFVEALPDREAMRQCIEEVSIPTFANIIEGGKTENLSALDLAQLGFCAVAYPWTLVAAKLKSIRDTLEALKKSMTEGAPPMILSYADVCEGVGFNKYWEWEAGYEFNQDRFDQCA